MDITEKDITITLTVSAGTRHEDLVDFMTSATNGWVSGLLVKGGCVDGLTECEYSVVCTRLTNKVAHLAVGDVPICDTHIKFYEEH